MTAEFVTTGAGPLAFPITPFRSDATLDLDTFRAHLRWMLTYTPPALFVACGAGEFASLDEIECRKLVGAAVEEAGPDIPVYAGVGQALPLAKRYAGAAEEAGAHGLLAFPPYLVAGEQEGLISYYRSLAESTSLPLVLYQRGNAVFEPSTVSTLAEIPNVVGFKDGLGEIERMQSIVSTVGPRLAYFNGMPTAETFQPAYRAMGVGHYSSAVFNFVPEVSWAFYRAIEATDDEMVARLFQTFFLPLAELRNRVRGYAVALVKAGVEIRWGPVGSVRPPLVDVRPEHVALLREIVERGLHEVGSD